MSVDSPAVEVATLAGGCFWCLEAVFVEVRGVRRVVSGYMGGSMPAPNYKAVCSGSTGHAEVVRVEFDPNEIAYKEILLIFFAIHDPTTLNRQGNDVGTQYRSAIFFHGDAQRDIALAAIRDLDAQRIWDSPIVTEVVPAEPFFPAEDYHQQYFANNPYQPYCQFVVAPKVAKFRKQFLARLRHEGAQPAG